MKTILKTILIFSLTFLSHSSFADPIQDNVFQVKRSGWFPSSATPCPTVCKKLNTENLRVASFCQEFKNQIWVNKTIDKSNNIKIENAILNKAKKLRLQSS